MANFYTDTPQFRHHLQHPLMKRIVELKERNYADKDKYDYAPMDFEDAMDSYDKVLEVVGEICADIIEPNAEEVDHSGPTVENGRVTYAPPTQQNLDALNK
ncbi:MAG: acyl-CoA dehydrogenase, partial [Proteiniphilum sp.]|nr:acyl-CoA dehydrogenase [Proteiniphilum sp.]